MAYEWTGTRYRDPATGRYLSRAAVRRALEESLANVGRYTNGLQDDLRAGRISLTDWRQAMRDTIKQVEMAAAELAKGGRAQMTPADYGRVGQRVRRQYGFLERWTAQIMDGLPLDNRMESRARQYLRHARSSFLAAERTEMVARGFDEIKTVRHKAEHCAECTSEEKRGFVPIGQHVPIGQRVCRDNCRCTALYRNSQTGQVLAA